MSISTFRNMRDIIFLVAGVGLFMVVLDISCRICCSMKKNRSSGGSPNTEMGIGTSTREMGNRGFEDNNSWVGRGEWERGGGCGGGDSGGGCSGGGDSSGGCGD